MKKLLKALLATRQERPHPPETPDALLRATADDVVRRLTREGRPNAALGSVLELVDNDETELALDHLAHIIECYRIPVLRAEYDRLVAVAAWLDSLDVLQETGVDRFVTQ